MSYHKWDEKYWEELCRQHSHQLTKKDVKIFKLEDELSAAHKKIAEFEKQQDAIDLKQILLAQTQILSLLATTVIPLKSQAVK
jgi:phage shock protein A